MLNNPIILGTKLPTLTNPGAAGDLLAGKQLIDQNGNVLTGTMPNRGAVNQTLNAGGSYSVPSGYHNGNGRITANSLASQTGGTATAADIADGKTAWVNGSKITGTHTESSGFLTKQPLVFRDYLGTVTATSVSVAIPSTLFNSSDGITYSINLEDILLLQYEGTINSLVGTTVKTWTIGIIHLFPFQQYGTVSEIFAEYTSLNGLGVAMFSPGTPGIGSISVSKSGRTITYTQKGSVQFLPDYTHFTSIVVKRP